MATTTTNIGLAKPSYDDVADIAVLNANFDTIDAEIASIKSSLSSISSSSVTGVKGSSESSYRTGNVNLTAANIGAAASSHTHNYAPTTAITSMSVVYDKQIQCTRASGSTFNIIPVSPILYTYNSANVGTYFTSGAVILRIMPAYCLVYVYLDAVVLATNSQSVMSLPNAYLPDKYFVTRIMDYTNNSWIEVNTNGLIKYAGAAGSTIWGSFMYHYPYSTT